MTIPQPVRALALAKEHLPDCKDAAYIISLLETRARRAQAKAPAKAKRVALLFGHEHGKPAGRTRRDDMRAWYNGDEVEISGETETHHCGLFLVATITNHPENPPTKVGKAVLLASYQYPEACVALGIACVQPEIPKTFRGMVPQVPW